MGYTHYWHLPIRKIIEEEWHEFQSDINRICKGETWLNKEVILTDTETIIHGPYESFRILLDDTGVPDSKFGLIIPKDMRNMDNGEKVVFGCCKTARKDYDYIIVASCMALKDNITDSRIFSDGNSFELKEGATHYFASFGSDFPLDVALERYWEEE